MAMSLNCRPINRTLPDGFWKAGGFVGNCMIESQRLGELPDSPVVLFVDENINRFFIFYLEGARKLGKYVYVEAPSNGLLYDYYINNSNSGDPRCVLFDPGHVPKTGWKWTPDGPAVNTESNKFYTPDKAYYFTDTEPLFGAFQPYGRLILNVETSDKLYSWTEGSEFFTGYSIPKGNYKSLCWRDGYLILEEANKATWKKTTPYYNKAAYNLGGTVKGLIKTGRLVSYNNSSKKLRIHYLYTPGAHAPFNKWEIYPVEEEFLWFLPTGYSTTLYIVVQHATTGDYYFLVDNSHTFQTGTTHIDDLTIEVYTDTTSATDFTWNTQSGGPVYNTLTQDILEAGIDRIC